MSQKFRRGKILSLSLACRVFPADRVAQQPGIRHKQNKLGADSNPNTESTNSRLQIIPTRRYPNFHNPNTMSLMMSSSFDPSLSTTMRPPLSSADAPSMADTLPSINFGFDELRDRMAKFTVRFDTFIEQGRKRVLEERNQFRMNVAELKGQSSSFVYFLLQRLTASQRTNG